MTPRNSIPSVPEALEAFWSPGAFVSWLEADGLTLAQLQPQLLGRFDGLLIDAPCSGLGTLARHADARWRITPAAIEELVALQRRLLEGLVPLLAPGGRLAYATCTVHPRENGNQIACFLESQPRLVRVLEQQWWPGEAAAKGEAGGGGDGFFASVLRS